MSAEDSPDNATPFRISSVGRHSMIYFAGLLVTKGVAILMLPIYTRWLTPSDYGVMQLIGMTFEIVTIFAGSRIALGIFHFYHKEDHDAGRRDVITTAFLLLAATYGLAAVLTVVAAPAIASAVFGENELYTTLIRLAAISMAFEGLIFTPLAVLQLQSRSRDFVVVSIARLGLQVALNLLFLIPMGLGVTGVLMSSVITHAVVGLSLGIRLMMSHGARFNTAIARSLVRFGVPLMAMQAATFIVTFGDRYFLNRATGTEQVGLYGLAYQFAFLVSTFGYGAFSQVWDPQRFEVAKRADRDSIFARVFVYLNLVLISVALGISMFAGDVLRLIASPEFHGAAVYVPVLAFALVFPCWSAFLNLGTYITERTEYYTLVRWASAAVAIAGYLLLIPRWLVWGAVITALLSLAVDAWLAHAFSQRLWPVAYRWKPVILLLALATAVAAVSVAMPTLPLVLSLGAHVALFGVFIALVWWSPVLSGPERAEIVSRLTRLIPERRPA